MNQDPDTFENPYDFQPERYLNEDDPLIAKVMQDTRGFGHWSFGRGRRSAPPHSAPCTVLTMRLVLRGCVGLNVANQALFINIARLLWAATIEPGPPIDPLGPPLYHDEENTSLVYASDVPLFVRGH